MQISKQLKKGQNKKDIEKFEKQLEDLKSSTDDGDIIKGKILELENLIKKYYTQKAEAAKIRSRIKWAEEGERSTRYFFELEKKQGENKMWNRIKNTEGKYKYDIDSIIDEQIKFYSKLFTTEGWDENSANKLTQHIESKFPNVLILVKQLLIFLQEFLQLFCSHCLIESVVSSFVYLPAHLQLRDGMKTVLIN
jgi:DNA repair exonuclease SbcCD ATPase subunit